MTLYLRKNKCMIYGGNYIGKEMEELYYRLQYFEKIGVMRL